MKLKSLKIFAVVAFLFLLLSIIKLDYSEPKLWQILAVINFTILGFVAIFQIKNFNKKSN